MLILVRKGNPKGIKDWDDLVKPGMQVVIVNPKTGGNGRYAYLAAWGYVKKKGGTDAQAAEFVGKLFKNVPILARGGRDATTAFLQRNIGDALITFESEVVSIDRDFGAGKVDADVPLDQHRGREPGGGGRAHGRQEGHRRTGQGLPRLPLLRGSAGNRRQACAAPALARPCSRSTPTTFKPLQLFTVQELFGSLGEAQKVHFNDGGQFDKLYTPGAK